MKVISTRISDELYEALQELCTQNNVSVAQGLAQACQGLISGKVRMRALGKRDICPRCGSEVHLLEGADNKLYFWCHRCDWMGYLGKFTMPKDIEDWRQKIKEV